MNKILILIIIIIILYSICYFIFPEEISILQMKKNNININNYYNNIIFNMLFYISRRNIYITNEKK